MEQDQLTKLISRENHLDSRVITLTKRRQWFIYTGLIVSIVPFIYYFSYNTKNYFYTIPISISYILIIFYLGVSSRIRLKENELREISLDKDIEKLDLEFNSLKIDKNIIYAEKTLRLHNDQLKKYYDLNLHQNSQIFRFGIFCIIVGFVILILTFIFIFFPDKPNKPTEQIVVGILGGVGSILSNYIAALYLKMNSSVAESLKEFHNKLIETHKLLMSNLLISKIEEQKLRENTYSELAKSMSCGDTKNGS